MCGQDTKYGPIVYQHEGPYANGAALVRVADYVNAPRQFKAATRTVSRLYGHVDGLFQHFAVRADLSTAGSRPPKLGLVARNLPDAAGPDLARALPSGNRGRTLCGSGCMTTVDPA